MGAYPLGNAVTITETFSILGVPTNPTTVTFAIEDPAGVVVEYVFGTDSEVSNPSTGVFVLDLMPPSIPGVYQYSVVGTGTVEAVGAGDFRILQSNTEPAPVTFALDGPCTPWCDARDIWVACGMPMTASGEGSSEDLCAVDMTPYAQMGSWLLWELSGRLHSGRCIRTVRPCSDAGCGWQILPRGFVVWPSDFFYGYSGWGWNGYNWLYDHNVGCGCVPLDRINLAGYPVREILEVKIDGTVIAPGEYRLDKRRFLTRMADSNGNAQRWPACQRLDEDDTEPGTFSVTYAYGQDPPLLGALAAAQLGCEFYRSFVGDDCQLPVGTIRITRQGVTVDKMATIGWYHSRQTGWRTGMPLVDAFLGGANPNGLTRRPMMFAPGQRSGRFAQSVGQDTP